MTLLDAFADQLENLGLCRQIGVAGVRQVALSAQLPTASMSMLTNAQTIARWSPNATASLMYGKNFSLFSTYFGANSVAVRTVLPTSLARSMIFRWPPASK